MNLQIDQPLFVTTINEYVSEKMAKGICFPLENISASTIRLYIQSGVLLADYWEKRILHTECRIPEKKLYELLERLIDNPHKDMGEELQQSKDYRKGIETLIKAYPELNDATIELSTNEIMDYLHAEGEPIYKAICYMLHYPKIDTNILYHLLTENKKLSSSVTEEELHSSVKYLTKTMDLPEGVFAKYGAQCFYFYEKGKMGYAIVHPDRSVKWEGEPLSPIAQNRINKIASGENYNYLNEPFFQSQAIGRINLLMADTLTGRFRDVYIEKYTDNQNTWDVMMEDGIPLKEDTTSNLVEMKGRLSQVQFAQRYDGMYIRCRIDGEMQMYEHVKPDDYQRYKEGKWDAQDLAARYFVRQFLSMLQDRQQSLKR